VAISRDTVDYLGKLSRIALSPEELDKFSPQLDGILRFVEKLKALPVREVPATAHLLKQSAPMREDRARPGFSPDQALQNAPEKEGPFFKVPPVIEAS